MAEPIVFISHNRVKAGMLEAFKQHYQDSIPRTEAAKPQTLAQLAYVSEDGSTIDIVRFFPNAEGLDLQLQGADDRSKTAYQFIEPTNVEIYGTPSEFALQMFKKVAGSGVEVRVYAQFIGGFMRPRSG